MKNDIQLILFLLAILRLTDLPSAFATPIDASVTPSLGYVLPVITNAADGQVLTTAQQRRSLHAFMDGKIVVLSFIYTTCSDSNGCPLATQVLYHLSRSLQKHPELTGKVRLITLSFDPEHDTPDVMRQFGARLNTAHLDWQFLTASSMDALQPLLAHYQQNVQKIPGSQSQGATYSHLLRMYLIDHQKRIRNIYNADYLSDDLILNDITTLLLDSRKATAVAMVSEQHQQGRQVSNLPSTATPQLINFALKPPLGLPKPAIPHDNPLTPAKIALGRKLFYDRRLSLNGTLSCAMCHIPDQGFSTTEMATAVGVEGRSVHRNTPSLFNVAYAQLLFHDGRENRLEQQAWGPLLAPNEMANPSIGFVVDAIKRNLDYRGLFEAAFARPAGMETIAQALACYQRTLNAADSDFDRWYYAKQSHALNHQAQRGFYLFTGKGGCSTCHTIGKHNALFTDQKRHNTGIGYAAGNVSRNQQQRVEVAPGVFVNLAGDQLATVSEPKADDLGYYEISQNPRDRWRYKTPSLRNIALSPPYMHNGSLANLEQVVQFYNQGGIDNDNLSPLIKPLNLSAEEVSDLVAFLRALTGSNVGRLVADGLSAPRGERQ
jgi:cytochrome c peroxidase